MRRGPLSAHPCEDRRADADTGGGWANRQLYWLLAHPPTLLALPPASAQRPSRGRRSCPITSASMRLHSAAYGLSSTSWRRANWLPSRAARSKSLRASSSRPCSRATSPRCTKPWRAVRPRPPLSASARSRSSRAPAGRTDGWTGVRAAASKIRPQVQALGLGHLHPTRTRPSRSVLLFPLRRDKTGRVGKTRTRLHSQLVAELALKPRSRLVRVIFHHLIHQNRGGHYIMNLLCSCCPARSRWFLPHIHY